LIPPPVRRQMKLFEQRERRKLPVKCCSPRMPKSILFESLPAEVNAAAFKNGLQRLHVLSERQFDAVSVWRKCRPFVRNCAPTWPPGSRSAENETPRSSTAPGHRSSMKKTKQSTIVSFDWFRARLDLEAFHRQFTSALRSFPVDYESDLDLVVPT